LFGCFFAPFGGFGLVADADEGVGNEGVGFGEQFGVALVLALAEAGGEFLPDVACAKPARRFVGDAPVKVRSARSNS
jgi:hypothetical protein